MLFENLKAETTYSFKVRAVNRDGHSDWTTVQATTKANPLEFAIKGITAETTCENQGGQDVNKLFDFDEKSGWHSKWGKGEAVPFDMLIDLNSVNQLDKFQYMARPDGGNGCLQEGVVYYSMDKNEWTEAGKFSWEAGGTHEFRFDGQPTARYIKLSVSKAVGNFGSGLEMYVFKVPGTTSLIPGDINRDNKVDENDLTSYMNYTGLRKGDGDFDYVSIGDLNRNNLIDAFDISAVGIKLETGVSSRRVEPVAGKVTVKADKKTYQAGETVEIVVRGEGLRSVNALSFALPYDTKDLEYVGVDAKGMKEMHNLTYDRLHTNGQKALYPTFVNLGEKPYLEDGELMIVRFKAKRKFTFDLKAIDGMIVDKYMNSVKF